MKVVGYFGYPTDQIQKDRRAGAFPYRPKADLSCPAKDQ